MAPSDQDVPPATIIHFQGPEYEFCACANADILEYYPDSIKVRCPECWTVKTIRAEYTETSTRLLTVDPNSLENDLERMESVSTDYDFLSCGSIYHIFDYDGAPIELVDSSFPAERMPRNRAAYLILRLMSEYDITFDNLKPRERFYISCDSKIDAHKPGFVYLLEMQETGIFKIGRSVNLKNRQKQFGVLLPFPVSLRHSISVEDMACAELALHNRYKDLQVNGEWYRLEPSEVEWICSLGDKA